MTPILPRAWAFALLLATGCAASAPNTTEGREVTSPPAKATTTSSAASAPLPSSTAEPGPPPVLVPRASTPAPTSTAAPRAWAPLPDGSRITIFRDLHVGRLPSPSRRNTWTLALHDRAARVRFEQAVGRRDFKQIDPATHDPSEWKVIARSEYVGPVVRSASMKMHLERSVQDGSGSASAAGSAPATIDLTCAEGDVEVHPAFATLVPGWKNDDDSMEPPSWAPPRKRRERALRCKVVAEPTPLLSFTQELAFMPAKADEKQSAAGLEWAFDNSDMVVQEGGYRYLPTSAGPF